MIKTTNDEGRTTKIVDIRASAFLSFIQECEHEIAFGNDGVVHHATAMCLREPIAARFGQFRVNEKGVAWKNGFAKFHVVRAHEITDPARALRQLHQQNACDLSHRFDLQDAGHHRVAWKASSEKRFVYCY